MPNQEIKYFWYKVGRFVSRILCRIFFRIKVQCRGNVPEAGALLLISNHQSFLDPLFCGCFIRRPLFFVARDSLFEKPVFGKMITAFNAIPIKRGEADLSAMKTILRRLQGGGAVCLFPEATRTSDGKVARLKAGFGFLARRSNAVIVPIIIDGAYECWPRHRKIFSPGQITVRYGMPMRPEEIAKLDDEQLAASITEILRTMQGVVRMESGKQPYQY